MIENYTFFVFNNLSEDILVYGNMVLHTGANIWPMETNTGLNHDGPEQIAPQINNAAANYKSPDDRAFRGTTRASLWLLTGW